LAHIVHPGGVQSLIAKGLHSDPGERARVNDKINLLMEVLKSVWGCGRKLTSGMQEYMRLPDGQVLFGEPLWGDPPA
jgi:hypothetical protein